ncbi:MAG: NAD(P)/FAD-dependent oxidoreductase, partial [Betaproteobacteria bacterium]|nr:NAD(P)/FAD-dependent oxidoreductase [Betaproteobacteria bacterium]
VEAEARFGEHASSRNSEVIHAGVYYPPGSNKARLCLRGKTLLYAYCAERHVPHRQLGKLIVATTSAEVAQLEAIRARALACGVELESRSQRQVAEMEPEILCSEALWSASSGIIDSHAYMQSLIGDIEHAGGTLVFRTPFLRAESIERLGPYPRRDSQASDAIWRVWLAGDDPAELNVHEIVNCAGLHAPSVAARIEGLAASGLPVQRYCRGHYFGMRGRNPFRHLVYPVPVQHGLGIHVTLDMAGQARFGPDVASWLDEIDYGFEADRAPVFAKAIRQYFPGLRDDQLEPSYTGIRAKISGPNDPAADFRIDGPSRHGVPGVVNLMGIESPGLTSSLAIGEDVVAALAG